MKRYFVRFLDERIDELPGNYGFRWHNGELSPDLCKTDAHFFPEGYEIIGLTQQEFNDIMFDD